MSVVVISRGKVLLYHNDYTLVLVESSWCRLFTNVIGNKLLYIHFQNVYVYDPISRESELLIHHDLMDNTSCIYKIYVLSNLIIVMYHNNNNTIIAWFNVLYKKIIYKTTYTQYGNINYVHVLPSINQLIIMSHQFSISSLIGPTENKTITMEESSKLHNLELCDIKYSGQCGNDSHVRIYDSTGSVILSIPHGHICHTSKSHLFIRSMNTLHMVYREGREIKSKEIPDVVSPIVRKGNTTHFKYLDHIEIKHRESMDTLAIVPKCKTSESTCQCKSCIFRDAELYFTVEPFYTIDSFTKEISELTSLNYNVSSIISRYAVD